MLQSLICISVNMWILEAIALRKTDSYLTLAAYILFFMFYFTETFSLQVTGLPTDFL